MNMHMKRNGFTLVEILVVVAVTAVLSGLAIVYSHVGQNQIALSVEESKVAQLILEAKELSIATYSTNTATCAYGVAFDYANSEYSLFEYNSASAPSGPGLRPICPSLASTTVTNGVDTDVMDEYANGSWNVHVSPGVALIDGGAGSSTIRYVLFYPPDPYTLISNDGKTFYGEFTATPATTGFVYLQTADGSETRTISVSPAGQVGL